MRSRMEDKTAVRFALPWALHALLLLTPGLLMVSGVRAMSLGSLVAPRPGDALVVCPLTEDVNQTKHNVVIRHFPYKGDPVTVFDCAWLKQNPDNPDCHSRYYFTLEAIGKDYVVTIVPQTQLQKDGSYKCQLVPPDDDELYTRCLVLHSGVRAMSVGSLVAPRPGDALVVCPLTEDVNQTKHNVVIRQFPYKGDPVTVFDCAWLKQNPDNPDCRSRHYFTLEAFEKDSVAVSVPRTQMHKNGSYKCQLVPPDDDEPYTRCLVLHSDDAEDPPTTIPDQPQPSDPTGANGDHTVVLAVFLTVVLILLVIVIVVAVVIFLQLRRRNRPDAGQEPLQRY